MKCQILLCVALDAFIAFAFSIFKCDENFCFVGFFQMWTELLVPVIFFFIFVVHLVHFKWDFEDGAHSQTALWTLGRGFTWIIAKLPWIYLLFSDAWVVLTLDVYLREPEKTPEMQRICLKTAVSFQAPPPLPNPATGQPNAIDSEPSCLLVAPLVLFLNAVCFSNSCASASINI